MKSVSKKSLLPRPRKLTRIEKNDQTKRRLFAAATKIVGLYGYAEASVSRITTEADIGQGTFYNHFEGRQELLDQLLPSLGRDLIDFIRDKVDPDAGEAEKELQRYKAFFEFLLVVPEFLRILNEAELFAPAGYQEHLDSIATGYAHILNVATVKAGRTRFSRQELEVIVHILLGARSYLGRQYAYGDDGIQEVPEYVISAYEKLITVGLFEKGENDIKPTRAQRDVEVVNLPVRAKRARSPRPKI